jgi:hypothetical protein
MTLSSEQLTRMRHFLGIRNPNAVQQVTITGNPTGGTFTLTYNGSTTSALAYNATPAVVQAALVALSSIGANGANVTGANGGPYRVTIRRDAAVALTGSGASLTGGSSPAVSVVVIMVFTDAELQDLYTFADEDWDVTLYHALWELLADASKLYDYSLAQTRVSKRQIWSNLKTMLDMQAKKTGAGGGSLRVGQLDLDLDRTDPADDTEPMLT